METKAKITNITRDFTTGKVNLTFTVDHYDSEEVGRLMEKDLRLRAVIWREKRSLDANGYYWVLLDKISGVLGSTKEEVHEIMLHRYGTYDLLDDGTPILISLAKHVNINRIDGHYVACKESSDGKHIAYIRLKGSRDMNTEEFARLLDGAIYEAKQMEIETLPPDEIERIKQFEIDNAI